MNGPDYPRPPMEEFALSTEEKLNRAWKALLTTDDSRMQRTVRRFRAAYEKRATDPKLSESGEDGLRHAVSNAIGEIHDKVIDKAFLRGTPYLQGMHQNAHLDRSNEPESEIDAQFCSDLLDAGRRVFEDIPTILAFEWSAMKNVSNPGFQHHSVAFVQDRLAIALTKYADWAYFPQPATGRRKM